MKFLPSVSHRADRSDSNRSEALGIDEAKDGLDKLSDDDPVDPGKPGNVLLPDWKSGDWATFLPRWVATERIEKRLELLRVFLNANGVLVAELADSGKAPVLYGTEGMNREQCFRDLRESEGFRKADFQKMTPFECNAGLEETGGCTIAAGYTFRSAKRTGSIIFAVQFSDVASKEEFAPAIPFLSSLVIDASKLEREKVTRKGLVGMLHQSQKLASVGRLATGIAHDFNNLLTVIQGHTSLLEPQMEEAERENAIESLGLIQSASSRAVDLSQKLLHFSRSEATEVQDSDLNEIVSGFIKMIRRMVEEHIEIRLELDERTGPVRVDRGMMEQILMNLIVNARDAMPGGGEIVIRTSEKMMKKPTKNNTGESSEEITAACLEVIDTGSGIPSEYLDKIFDPFFSTKEKGKGTGLGLPNVAALMKDHHGTIEVESEVGKGTRFELLFPLSTAGSKTESASSKVSAHAQEEGTPPGMSKRITEENESIRGATVLLVEDEAAVRKLVRKLLEMNGCTVIEAASGREALERWPEICGEVTAVVSDVIMPGGVSGWDLARHLHESCPNLGILLTSGYSDRPEDHGLETQSQIAFLQKPYEAKKLKQNLFHLIHPAA